MKLFNLGNGLCVQSGIFLTKFGHRLLLYLLSLILCERAEKNNCWTLCILRQSNFRPSYFFNSDAYVLDFCAQNYAFIFSSPEP